MISYGLGVFFGIIAGISNFLGQILQKKAINELSPEKRAEGLMKSLIRNRTWVSGLIIMMVVCSVFMFLAQMIVGAALVPGLMASGFIVLAIGSALILKEKLTFIEILSMVLLIIAVVVISFSQLSIEASMTYFDDSRFNLRISIYSFAFVGLWFGLFFYGKNANKFKSITLALGTAFPFVLNNIWMGPLAASIAEIIGRTFTAITWIVLAIGTVISILVNIVGISHYQYALEAGNASLVVPMQQLPQQVAPIIIYFFIYRFTSPTEYSLLLLIIGIILITIAGFILASRQVALEKIKEST